MRRDILRAGLCMAAVSALLLGCGRDLPREADRQQTDVSAAETRSPEQLEEETSEKTEEETKKPSETAVLPEKEEAEIPEKVPEESLEEKIGSILGNMTLEEKVAQMFIVLPEGLTGAGCVTAAGETTRDAIREVPVGGFIYMEQNLESASQVQEMLSNVQSYSMERIGLPVPVWMKKAERWRGSAAAGILMCRPSVICVRWALPVIRNRPIWWEKR